MRERSNECVKQTLGSENEYPKIRILTQPDPSYTNIRIQTVCFEQLSNYTFAFSWVSVKRWQMPVYGVTHTIKHAHATNDVSEYETNLRAIRIL